MTTTDRFSGRTAIVTGAASGIGRATALRLAGEGARVVAADVALERLEDLVHEQHGLDLVPVGADITSSDGVQAIVDAAGERIDVLANVAGIMDGFLPAHEVDDATWERVMAINVTAVMRLTRAVLPTMMAARSGTIVNIASEAAVRGAAAGVAYTAAKHALVGITKNTAVLYAGHGIRVNAVAPGPTMTAIQGSMKSQHAAGVLGPLMQAMVPTPVEADVMAASIAWLASDDAANVTGVLLPSDGGWSAI